MPGGLGPALEAAEGQEGEGHYDGHRGCWGWWSARLALPRSRRLGWEGAHPALLGSVWPPPQAYFLRLLMALRPWGAARQSEGLRGTPTPSSGLSEARNGWNSQEFGNLSRNLR